MTLSDGRRMPLIGLGTSGLFGSRAGEPGYDALMAALRCGYRFIDTATLYENEASVGRALADAISEGLVKREELFICTKVWCTAHKRSSVVRACRESLERLQLDYVDLYLIHWPVAYEEEAGHWMNPKDLETGKLRYSGTHFTETWLGMEDAKELGLVRSIGLSNFNHSQIDEILAMPCRHRPVVNQVECHPYLSQAKLLDYCNKQAIVLTAYCPLGSPNTCAKLAGPDKPPLMADPTIRAIAERHGKSAAQVLVRFQVQRGVSVIPKSGTPRRIEENIGVLDFELSVDEMEQLLGLNKDMRYCLDTAGEFISDHPLYPFHAEY